MECDGMHTADSAAARRLSLGEGEEEAAARTEDEVAVCPQARQVSLALYRTYCCTTAPGPCHFDPLPRETMVVPSGSAY